MTSIVAASEHPRPNTPHFAPLEFLQGRAVHWKMFNAGWK
jgi:hypothetical protein